MFYWYCFLQPCDVVAWITQGTYLLICGLFRFIILTFRAALVTIALFTTGTSIPTVRYRLTDLRPGNYMLTYAQKQQFMDLLTQHM